jgi:lipid A 4'-phosphatase
MNKLNNMLPRRAKIELGVLMLLMSTTTALFWLSDWDIRVAEYFYNAAEPKQPWPLKTVWLVKPIYDYAFAVIFAFGCCALLTVLASYRFALIRRFRKSAFYVLLVILLGPGLMVNLVFKDHWGRPRPLHISELGGQYAYVPPLQFGDTPDKSFVCGHCSVGYAAFAVYFLAQEWLLAYALLAAGLGLLIGWTRMAVGGHFLSDVLWSGYTVFLVAYLLFYGWYARDSARYRK